MKFWEMMGNVNHSHRNQDGHVKCVLYWDFHAHWLRGRDLVSHVHTHSPPWNGSSFRRVAGDWQRSFNHSWVPGVRDKAHDTYKRQNPLLCSSQNQTWPRKDWLHEEIPKKKKKTITAPFAFSSPFLGENHSLPVFTVWFCGLIEGQGDDRQQRFWGLLFWKFFTTFLGATYYATVVGAR